MKQLITIAILVMLPFCAMAEKKVSRIYDSYNDETELLSYDEQGRLISWKHYYHNNNDDPVFDLTFDYVGNNSVILYGTFDFESGVRLEATLNDDNLVTYVKNSANEDYVIIEYKDGAMIKLTHHFIYDYEDLETHIFQIENGNPVNITRVEYNDNDFELTYSERPNKCGLIYLPMITCNTAWAYRAFAYAGLFGYGSRTLPSTSRYWSDQAPGVIDYTFDSDGYIRTMKVTNGNDGDGDYTFEYTEVNGIYDVETEEPAMKVYSIGNKIVVEGEYSRLAVYNLQGSECDNSNLSQGIYIADVDNQRYKVLVH